MCAVEMVRLRHDVISTNNAIGIVNPEPSSVLELGSAAFFILSIPTPTPTPNLKSPIAH